LRIVPSRGRPGKNPRENPRATFSHFSALAGATDRPVPIYNIPYRTGIDLANDTLLRLEAPLHDGSKMVRHLAPLRG
jgi:dihydrodipicolinate synthase/N-acetylneuraminate lyase